MLFIVCKNKWQISRLELNNNGYKVVEHRLEIVVKI